jgi:hypothetical protein
LKGCPRKLITDGLYPITTPCYFSGSTYRGSFIHCFLSTSSCYSRADVTASNSTTAQTASAIFLIISLIDEISLSKFLISLCSLSTVYETEVICPLVLTISKSNFWAISTCLMYSYSLNSLILYIYC